MSAHITIHTGAGTLRLPLGATLADAVEQVLQAGNPHGGDPDASPQSVATAVNGEFVPRAQRAHHPLHDGDTVLCFAPITGG